MVVCMEHAARHAVMNRQEFNAFLQRLNVIELEMSNTKGNSYANDKDALANFKRLAVSLDLDPVRVCFVYMAKHYDSLASYARLGKDITGEGVASRVVDLRLFAALFLALVRDEEAEKLVEEKVEENDICPHGYGCPSYCDECNEKG